MCFLGVVYFSQIAGLCFASRLLFQNANEVQLQILLLISDALHTDRQFIDNRQPPFKIRPQLNDNRLWKNYPLHSF